MLASMVAGWALPKSSQMLPLLWHMPELGWKLADVEAGMATSRLFVLLGA